MKERKYKEDWANETRFDDKGREKRVPVYRGPRYHFAEGENGKKLAGKALTGWIVFTALIFLYFIFDFPGGRILYVFLPAGLSLFPCMYWAMGVWGISRAGEKMTRLQKENGVGRVLRSAAGCALCIAAALIGEAVWLIGGADAGKEWPGLMLLLGAGACALGTARMFRDTRKQMKEEGGEKK